VQSAFRQRLAAEPAAAGLFGEPQTLLGDTAWAIGLYHFPRWGRALFVLSLGAIAILVMLLPALSLANVTMGALQERRREIGVRRAFGASARQIAVQVLIENLVLTGAGAVLAAAPPLVAGVCRVGADDHFRLSGFNHLTPGAWAALAAFAVAFAALSGALPAWRIARLQPLEALRGGPR
jgi:putative ABC transport system permease protein